MHRTAGTRESHPTRIARASRCPRSTARRKRTLWYERLHLATSMRSFRTEKVSAFVNAIDVRVNVDPVQWFLNDRHDTRSSYYLEDAATEFQVQGRHIRVPHRPRRRRSDGWSRRRTHERGISGKLDCAVHAQAPTRKFDRWLETAPLRSPLDTRHSETPDGSGHRWHWRTRVGSAGSSSDPWRGR